VLKLCLCILASFFYVGQCVAQSGKASNFRLWKLASYNGSVGVRGFYRVQKRILNDVVDNSQFPFLYGGVSLYTTSYIGHPQLLQLDIGGEYNPGISQQTYTVSPDRSEVLTFKKFYAKSTLFNNKPMSLSAHVNFSQDFINREYVTSLATDAKEWGLQYDFRNKILPLTASYSERDWAQKEIETGRTFLNQQNDLQISAGRSFTKFGDKNEIKFTRFEYFREDENNFQVYNLYDNAYLNNTIFFDKNKKVTLRSSINHLNQVGNLNQLRFQVFENLRVKLKKNLSLSGSYDYTANDQIVQKFNQHRIGAKLDHRLYSSLTTNLTYDKFITNHSAYDENNTWAGVSFRYRKKIPKGTLNLLYSYRRHFQNVVSNQDEPILITNEPHTLSDGQIELLERPYVIIPSVIVKDAAGVVIYQKDFDYFLFERGNGFVEIQRIPGGQIPNDGNISVDYLADQVGSYNFDAITWRFTAKVNLFKRLIEVYYTVAGQDYENIEFQEILTLNYYSQNIYGVRIQVGPFSGGVERDLFNSTIVPYDKFRYFMNINGPIGKKTLLSLNGEITHLTLIEEDREQFYSSIFGKAVYMFGPRTKLNLNVGYRKQVGEEIDLDMLTGKLECNYVIRRVWLKVGVEMYYRDYVGENIRFKGVYFQIDRRF
jgi:hypothetical protein